MTVIITDTGFGPDTWEAPVFVPAEFPANANPAEAALFLPSDTDVATLATHIGRTEMIEIDFPSFADGRGFTLARRLRDLGYQGRLRAVGHVISDQYAMARRSGFDEVAISEDQAERQPESEWLFRADWTAHSYQARLSG